MQVRVDVRQEQASELVVGQPCTIKAEVRKGQAYAGEVIRIDPAANLARDTIRARVKVLKPDDALRKDMTVTVDFLPRQETDDSGASLVLPLTAITRRDGNAHVFLVRDGRAQLRPVVLGEEVAAGVVVQSGVVAGDLVATSNLALLHDGAPVRLDLGAQ
jgi:multidrug efflux system membrane fusion protein